MKTIVNTWALLLLTLFLTACSDNADDPVSLEANPLEGFNLLSRINSNNHTLEVYSEASQLTVGYNELYLRIRDQATDTYLSNADITWMPVMHMADMDHSCPRSLLSPTENASVYKGFAVFQMPGNAEEYWDLTLNYQLDGQSFSVTEQIDVREPADALKRVNVFMGSDGTRYVLAMMPLTPAVAVNDFSAMLFEMETMMSFPVVEDHVIKIDPRMPGMGNHSSPNNEDLAFDPLTTRYRGKLSLTMTGYWRINLMLQNANGDVLKGEPITETNENSSLYFELEF
mgnify:CR=1 FL=1